jgi:hypothetical protein
MAVKTGFALCSPILYIMFPGPEERDDVTS